MITLISLIVFVELSPKSNYRINRQQAICGTESRSEFSGEHFNAGKLLFKRNCATCHAKNMRTKATGPPLFGVIDYWADDSEALLHYLNNSQVYFKTYENARLVKLKNEYNVAPSHQNKLTYEEVGHIFTFIEEGLITCSIDGLKSSSMK